MSTSSSLQKESTCIYTEQKWKRHIRIVRNVSIKGNKNANQQMIYIQVKWLGYALKQTGGGL